MAAFFKLQERLPEVARDYFVMTQASSDTKGNEMKAIIKLQSIYRASKVREKWHAVLSSALLVQRLARGWLGRVRTQATRRDRMKRLNTVFFHHCSTVVQKFFRGWWSRKYLHDYYGRKNYIQKIEERGAWTKEYLRNEHAANVEQAKVEEENQMRQEFDNLAGELHHLVSTRSIAGVYNPPFNDALPSAFSKPIEQHLRDSLRVRMPKSLRRPRHRSLGRQHISQQHAMGATDRGGGVGVADPPQDLPDRQPLGPRSASVGRLQKIQGPFRSKEQIEVSNAKASNQYSSVQANVPYGAMEHDRRMQEKISKLTRVSPIDFCAPGLPPAVPPPSSVHACAPYRDRPAELRTDYCELPKIRDKPPFFTAMPAGRHFEDYQDQHLLPCGAV